MLIQSPVLIIEAHNIILAQVIARLHLNNLQINLALVLQFVLYAGGYISRFVGRHTKSFFSPGDGSCSPYHHPVLRTMTMQLQRNTRARLDNQSLDLKAAAFIQTLI